jgi:pimeloyl-ACP methyl ester carboxylesterase
MTATDTTNTMFTTGEVTSRDGTRIGYRQVGRGPGLVLLHGSMQSAASHTVLATALADAFTVYLPDRRGRGRSGPAGEGYAVAREVEDVDALLTHTGARNLFGVSSSGLIALQSALMLPTIDRLAVYEPALLLPGYDPGLTSWLPRFDREIAEGATAAALITSMIGLQLGPAIFNRMPRWLLEGFTNMALKSEDKKAAADDVTMRKLAPTLHCEGQLIAEMAGPVERFGAVSQPVLLMGGSNGLAFITPALDALERTLPQVRRVRFTGLDHGGCADASKANPKGRPEQVAPELRRFFSAA